MMIYIKKLIFAPIFLISFAFMCILLIPFLKSPLILLAVDWPSSVQIVIQLLILTGVLLLTNMFFTIFATLAQNIRLVIPIAILGAALPLIFIINPLNYVLMGGFIASILITYPLLSHRLKTYITFQPTVILSPTIKSLTIFMALMISFTYYLAANAEIKKNGFQIPDKLIEAVLNLAGSGFGINVSQPTVRGVKYVAQLPSLTQEQINELKKNPELLKQFGIDSRVLDSLPTTGQKQSYQQTQIPNTQNAATKLIRDQIQNMIKPFIPAMPAILASILFSVLFTFEWLLSFFLSPLLLLIFWIFKKTGLVTFQTEMREVQKMVV